MEIEPQLRAFAKKRGIKEEDYETFKANILKGLSAMKLRTDKIEVEKFKAIAARKDAQALAEKQEADSNGGKENL